MNQTTCESFFYIHSQAEFGLCYRGERSQIDARAPSLQYYLLLKTVWHVRQLVHHVAHESSIRAHISSHLLFLHAPSACYEGLRLLTTSHFYPYDVLNKLTNRSLSNRYTRQGRLTNFLEAVRRSIVRLFLNNNRRHRSHE